MRHFIARFRSHPASVGESYFGHMGFALRFSLRLFGAALAAFVHALIPPLFETRASESVARLCDEMRARHAAGDDGTAGKIGQDTSGQGKTGQGAGQPAQARQTTLA